MDNFSAVDALAIVMASLMFLALLASRWIGRKTRALRASNIQRRDALDAHYRAHKVYPRKASRSAHS